VAGEKAETGLAGRYANAVFELAQEQRAIDALSADFAALRRAVDASPDFARLVRSPVFGSEAQARAMKAVLEKMGAGKLTLNLVLLLAAKRRLFALDDVIAAYERLVARSRGETEAQVTSARALSDNEVSDLKAILKSRLGKEPRLATKVDPTLLGGLIIKVGSRMIDSSIRTKLTGLAAVMKGQ
jgi:F-type H+-transporting ATPase subunit delta